ncbi:P1 family peptidase [Luteimonas saliphila]|uniref:P1 family peptidase n=1 Tax=Luteimonas saliphila TaxID=2804919 RepID=UPI00192D43DB|nr:P1 family peptidase [Luteimonas saliphila]
MANWRSAWLLVVVACGAAQAVELPDTSVERPRAREAGVVIGLLPTGPRNAIVDVPGVAVGHATVFEGDAIRTGVTAILPHPGDLYRERVPAAIVIGNGYGKLLGVSQVAELGELETPILLTGTLGVWRAADALVGWQLAKPGMEEVRSLNPVVGETNDGYLNDIRARPLRAEHVVHALEIASTDNVQEGAIGAGTGTVAFGWKGGIGTSSRRLDEGQGGHTVGVLVQSNYGGRLTIGGMALDDVRPERTASRGANDVPPATGDGSIMIVVATDAPLDDRLLRRLAARALLGVGRTGSSMSNGSGDYVIAFSTAREVRRSGDTARHAQQLLSNESMSPLFDAVVEATEEAIINSLFRATTTRGHRGNVPALPLERVLPRLRRAVDAAP